MRLPGEVAVEDLMSAGLFGLMDAIAAFEQNDSELWIIPSQIESRGEPRDSGAHDRHASTGIRKRRGGVIHDRCLEVIVVR